MPNLLANEKSPYLRQHAGNPVDWHPWGEEAFARARAEDKPIFLSIGYSTCHWCHVMAHESFENAAVAQALNRDFIAVKVDREERPDVDRLYMTYVQQTTGHGGWPMSVWLTPSLEPFYGGTYYPPEDRDGRPGFVTLLEAIARHWREQRQKIQDGAAEVVAAIRRHAAEGSPRPEPESGEPHAPLHVAAGNAFEKCFQYFYESFDPEWGGFGGAPKFPRGSAVNFLFRVAALQGAESDAGREAVRLVTHTLQKMAEGGIHDHVGGGFHRYSVDERWFVPHFEKMLYDQAQIAVNYLEARQATGREVYAWIARGILDYVATDLSHPGGGFYSAEDADSARPENPAEHAEGAFYVWTKTEIDAALPADAALVEAHFGIRESGNVANDPQGEFTGRNVLMQQQSLAVTARAEGMSIDAANERLVAALGKLRQLRALRPRPHRDEKVIAAWNGLMISAFARAHQILPADRTVVDGDYLGRAVRAAKFMRDEMTDQASVTLYRNWREGRGNVPAFAEDYAFLIQGLLDLYEAGFDIAWLRWAEELQAAMDARFWDEAGGGYFASREDDPSLLVRMKDDYDGAEPAASSVAALNLVRLDWMLGGRSASSRSSADAGYRERALATVESLRSHWSRIPQALPQMLVAVEAALSPPRTVVLAGDRSSPEFAALVAVVHESLGVRRALLAVDGGEAQRWLASRKPYLADYSPRDGRPTAFVCEDFTCQSPVSTPEELRRVLNDGIGTWRASG